METSRPQDATISPCIPSGFIPARIAWIFCHICLQTVQEWPGTLRNVHAKIITKQELPSLLRLLLAFALGALF